MIQLSTFGLFWPPHPVSRFCRNVLLFFTILIICQVYCDDHHLEVDPTLGFYHAEISYRYKESKKQELVTSHIQGKFGQGTHPVKAKISGKVIHITSRSKGNRKQTDHYGCEKYTTKLPSVKWIALVERGDCEFTKKLHVATVEHNASAVLIYDNATMKITRMRHKDIKKNVAVLIAREDGLKLVTLLDKGVNIEMDIYRGQRGPDGANMNNSSVLFVSISFIIIVIISVAWLMFYYIRKFRYSHAKERLAKRLARAAKKAIAKIPQRTVSVGDKELEGDFDQCAICIEPYKDGDIIRLMPCRHVFHKSCVDPWLLDHRTCPMCKLDILQAYGMSMCKLDMLAYGMQSSQESMQRDLEGGGVMLQSIPSVDEGGRSESAALVLDDPGASSSLEDEAQATSEVKVVLVPHSCLHYHHLCDAPDRGKVFEEDEEEDPELEASTGLLAGSGSCEHVLSKDGGSGSSDSLNSIGKGRKNIPGWGKVQGRPVSHTDEREMEALIKPSGIEREEEADNKEDIDHRESFEQVEGHNEKAPCDPKIPPADVSKPDLGHTEQNKSLDSASSPCTKSCDDLQLTSEFGASQELVTDVKQSKV